MESSRLDYPHCDLAIARANIRMATLDVDPLPRDALLLVPVFESLSSIHLRSVMFSWRAAVPARRM